MRLFLYKINLFDVCETNIDVCETNMMRRPKQIKQE